jgi:transposase
MTATVFQINKKSGIKYAYKSISYWDKQKKQSRSKRTCIGRVDSETGEIIPTRKKKKLSNKTQENTETGSLSPYLRKFYGATYLFNEIGKQTGVIDDLRACFPDHYHQLLSIAYYLILEDRNPLSRFPHWAILHEHPYGNTISSQRSSDLFSGITEDAKQHFFKKQGNRRAEKEYLAYDSTSISSYSAKLRQVRYGKNKEHDRLPQLNLTLLFGQNSQLPFYYRKLPGNITDVKTLRKLIFDMNELGYSKIKVVLDRGFYSAENINDMYRHHMKFLIGGKVSLKLIKNHLNIIREGMRDWKYYNPDTQLYMRTLPISWTYEQPGRFKKDIKADRRMYLHFYFSPEKALEDEKMFHERLSQWQDELINGQQNPENEKFYKKYFDFKTTPVRGTKVSAKEKALGDARRDYGYFVLMSNDIKDPSTALTLYRSKDCVEKAFENIKDRLNLRRVAVSSERSLDGKLFVQFLALIFLSFITKKMKDANLFKIYTLQQVLDELDLIECFSSPGKPLHIGEITKKQLAIYSAFDIAPPASLQ